MDTVKEPQGLLFVHPFLLLLHPANKRSKTLPACSASSHNFLGHTHCYFFYYRYYYFSSWRMRQYLHVRSSTSSLCWANERTWLGREAKNWLQWRCNLARLKKGRSTCSIHYVNRSTQSALTELCEMNAYTDVKNARKRWRKNGALQTRHLVSPPLNLPGDLSSLSKLACFVMYDILAVLVRALIITSVWFRLFVFFFFWHTVIFISPICCIFDRWMLAFPPHPQLVKPDVKAVSTSSFRLSVCWYI